MHGGQPNFGPLLSIPGVTTVVSNSGVNSPMTNEQHEIQL